ncbi:MAG TPA: thiamine pyrophosphate-binding protein [Acidimicrobiales bacterium]|nr:thiamine pyrophosphate-binding protein [Acidimicrobiales bacterium]
MDQHTGGDAVLDVLEQAGVEVVFGIPSVHNLPVYDAIRRRGTVRAITVRHEQAAAGAADAYARVTGRLGVFITSTGPGAANAMGGLLEAFVSGSPVLHLTGQVETRHLDAGRGFIHEVPDQPAMLASLSKSVLRAESVDDVAVVTATAVSIALSAPKGPVSVELPIDLQYAEAALGHPEVLAQLLVPAEAPATAPADLRRAAELVGASRRPLVWAGGGTVAAGAEAEVAELVHRLGAGLLTSPNARGVLPEDDAACIGNLPWDPDVRALCREADLLIGVGTRYQGPNTENWHMELPATIVQIDVVPERPARNYEPTVALAGDARATLQDLSAALDAVAPGAQAEEAWPERVAAARAAARSRLRHVIGAQEGLLDELSAAIGPETVVVKDSTIPAYTWGNRLLPVARSRRAIMPNGFAIGLGLAHAIGAGVAALDASPGSPAQVVLMVGDGGVMLTAPELATLAAERLPVLVLVFADGGYGILRNIQDKQYGEGDGRIGVELGSPDFVSLAGAFGVPAGRVATTAEFGKAVREGLSAARPCLVEIDLNAIGPMARPYTGTSRPPAGATQAE